MKRRETRAPITADCHCGCLGVQEYHEATTRLHAGRKADREKRMAPVVAGPITNKPQFGALGQHRGRKRKSEDVEE